MRDHQGDGDGEILAAYQIPLGRHGSDLPLFPDRYRTEHDSSD